MAQWVQVPITKTHNQSSFPKIRILEQRKPTPVQVVCDLHVTSVALVCALFSN